MSKNKVKKEYVDYGSVLKVIKREKEGTIGAKLKDTFSETVEIMVEKHICKGRVFGDK